MKLVTRFRIACIGGYITSIALDMQGWYRTGLCVFAVCLIAGALTFVFERKEQQILVNDIVDLGKLARVVDGTQALTGSQILLLLADVKRAFAQQAQEIARLKANVEREQHTAQIENEARVRAEAELQRIRARTMTYEELQAEYDARVATQPGKDTEGMVRP